VESGVMLLVAISAEHSASTVILKTVFLKRWHWSAALGSITPSNSHTL